MSVTCTKRLLPEQVRVQLPALLKQKLIEDLQRVDRGEQQAMPRKPSISDILQQYVDSTKGMRDTVEPEEEASFSYQLSASCICFNAVPAMDAITRTSERGEFQKEAKIQSFSFFPLHLLDSGLQAP